MLDCLFYYHCYGSCPTRMKVMGCRYVFIILELYISIPYFSLSRSLCEKFDEMTRKKKEKEKEKILLTLSTLMN